MAGRIDFTKLQSPMEFQQLCERLLARIYPDFHPVNQAGGDQGVDGFSVWGEEIFQFTHLSGNVPLRKVREDLDKVREQFPNLKKWHFLCSKPLSAQAWRFIESERQSCTFQISAWDGSRLADEFSKHPDLVDEFFPEYAKKAYEGTQQVRTQITDLGRGLHKAIREVKRKPPRAGDAPPGLEIDSDESEDLAQIVYQLVEEEAKRKRREPISADYGREWGEFNAHFELSAKARLPKSKFAEAREYLRQKLFARRNREPRYFAIQRAERGIHAIANALGWSEEERRQFYRRLTGKGHLPEMTNKEKMKVFNALRRRQTGLDSQ